MSKIETNNVVKTSILLATAIVIQFFGRNFPQINQFLVGPVINTILILTTIICGLKWGILTGLLTPVLALIVGQLSLPMAPFIPFIIMGNIIYVIVFKVFSNYKYGDYIGILISSVFKYLFLSFSAKNVVKLIGLNLPNKILEKLAIMMSTPQLITALCGGIFAISLIAMLSKRNLIKL